MTKAAPSLRAIRHLTRADRDMATLIERIGPCGLIRDDGREPYDALVRAIVYQQLHGRAAAAIFARLEALGGGCCPVPEVLTGLSIEELRACGLSARKVTAVQGLAQAVLDGVVPSRRAAGAMTDDALIARLTPLVGIGRWTVEMLLIFTLGRPDIMPADDFGVRDGWRRIKGHDAQLRPRELLAQTQSLSPYRSVATWYLWRASEAGKAVTAGAMTGADAAPAPV